jgi:hypothetical protein
MITSLERAVIAHLLGDWLLQNDWMAKNKEDLKHPAAWVHGLIHTSLMVFALGLWAGIILGAAHMLIDTREPLRWWRGFYRQTIEGPSGFTVAIWADQVLHVLVIAAWVILTGGG